jgi:hypothetical protein
VAARAAIPVQLTLAGPVKCGEVDGTLIRTMRADDLLQVRRVARWTRSNQEIVHETGIDDSRYRYSSKRDLGHKRGSESGTCLGLYRAGMILVIMCERFRIQGIRAFKDYKTALGEY